MTRFTTTLFSFMFLSVLLTPALTAPVTPEIEARGYSGRGTWFEPGLGACGEYSDGGDYIVALNGAQYGSGGSCGEMVTIKNNANGKTVKAKVLDMCPSCPWGALDLSPNAFKSIGNLDTGVLSISWSFM